MYNLIFLQPHVFVGYDFTFGSVNDILTVSSNLEIPHTACRSKSVLSDENKDESLVERISETKVYHIIFFPKGVNLKLDFL